MNAPTFAEIEASRTPKGGWTRDTLAKWGVPWPPPPGWLEALSFRSGTSPLQRACPTCKANAGQACTGRRGDRKAFHRARGRTRRTFKPHPVDNLKTESPIEGTLAGFVLGWIDHHGANATVTTQARIGPYRADMLVEQGERKLVVECDGADFHCTTEQVQRDKRRDRYCAARGLHVMRFSGAEINKDPRGCAAEVGMWIMLR